MRCAAPLPCSSPCVTAYLSIASNRGRPPLWQLCSLASLCGTWRQSAPLVILLWFCVGMGGFFSWGHVGLFGPHFFFSPRRCVSSTLFALSDSSSNDMLRYLTIATAASLPSYSSAFASPAGMHPCPLVFDHFLTRIILVVRSYSYRVFSPGTSIVQASRPGILQSVQ